MALTAVSDILLAVAVSASWLAAIAFLRLRTAFDRLHVVTFINVATGGALALAAAATDGASSRTFKCFAIWIAMVLFGALLTHVSARALHLRSGERR
jgi:multisubunit Na+/H+ antiporter MnhG subunit